MSVTEVKLEIIQRISGLSDSDLLDQIYKLLELQKAEDEVYILSTQERQAIEAGLEDVKSGRVFSSEEAKGMLNKWLKK